MIHHDSIVLLSVDDKCVTVRFKHTSPEHLVGMILTIALVSTTRFKKAKSNLAATSINGKLGIRLRSDISFANAAEYRM